MWDYSEKVLDLFYNPVNQGALEPTDEPDVAVVFGEVGSIACGDALRLHLKIQESQQRILDARFQTFGCTSAIASSSALTELIKGKTLDEALRVTNHDIAAYLGGLPEAKMHCSVMGQEALEAAIYKYRGVEVEHHDEDDEGSLICKCFGVIENRVRRIILANDLQTVDQVTHYLKAVGGCGSCLAGIEDVLLEVQRHPAATRVATAVALQERPLDSELTAPRPLSPSLTTLQKITLIQQVINEEIRPVLLADGGDVELHDVDGDLVLVKLTGACHGCASSGDTVRYAIAAQLRDRVSPTLLIEAI
jgi:NifU-like protein